MFVLHALWRRDPDGVDPGRLALWAEDSAAVAPKRRPGRAARVQPHPFVASHERLAQLHPALGVADLTTVTLELPARGRRPVDSPELVRDEVADASGVLSIKPWTVPVAEVAADRALALLGAIDPDRAVAGSSLTHLTELVRFAADLVARGRLLPGVEIDPPRAMWRPVLTGPDAAWARSLAGCMPRALAATEPDHGIAVWADALDGLVDATARSALNRGKFPRAKVGNASTRAWLAALTGPSRQFDADPITVEALARAVNAWQQDVLAGPVRACFRLVEPADDDVWKVRLALQATDEPSLVVDADEVWRARGTLPALARQLDSPQETMLTELGKASRVYRDLDAALQVARPTELALDTEGAHRFLSVAAPALATAGFGVQLPGWWTKPSARLGLRMTVRTPAQPGLVAGATGQLGFAALAEFSHELAVGGEVLSQEELDDLATAVSPMVRLRGQWIELDARRLAAGLKLVGRTQTATVGELLRLGLGIEQTVDDLPIEGFEAEGWLGELLNGGSESKLAPVAVPNSFDGTLRPYQERGLAWLAFLHQAGLGGVLADDMGLGKTVQLLALLAHDAGSGPSLLVCPMSLVGSWQREAAKFTPDLRVHVHHGQERARGKKFAAAVEAADLVVTTYAIAARDSADLSKITWRRLIVDEAQAIKNAATKQAVAIRSLPADSRIAVTGTPVENRLADLWSILEFTNPGLLGSAARFRKRYAEPIERHGDDQAAERLRRFTQPFVLRRLKTDKSIIADLPEKLEMDVLCNLTAEQAALYQAVLDDMLERIESTDGIERRGLVLATMTKLKQVCNHPAQFMKDGSALAGRSGKLERLDEIVDEVLAVGEKALLFTQYAEFGAMMRGHLAGRTGREVLFLHGGVSKAGRDDMVARFQTEGAASPPLFVLSLKAGGTGLTLTAANHVVHVDRWWNPAVEDQATDRAFRIGQRRAVQVRKFVCAGTVEERIAAMIRDKRGLAARIVGTGEQWLTEMSTGQLRELFKLESAAVVE